MMIQDNASHIIRIIGILGLCILNYVCWLHVVTMVPDRGCSCYFHDMSQTATYDVLNLICAFNIP